MMDGAERRLRFLIGGVQKGGTTALFEHLKRDLAVSLPLHLKEAHFFDDEAQNWARPDYQAYHGLFDPADRRPRGEATPIYLYWPNSLERIADYEPAIRLIFIFREPAERAWSHWRMETRRELDDAPFGWAIREGRARLEQQSEASGAHRVYSYVERGFYGAQLRHALMLFSREQMLLLRAEDLKADPNGILRRVAAHIGVPAPSLPVESLRANVGEGSPIDDMSPPAHDMGYLRALYAEDAAEFSHLSGLTWPQAAAS